MSAAGVGAANIRLGADISGFLRGISQVSAQISTLTVQVNSQLTDSFRRADNEAKVFKAGLGRLGDDIQGIGAKMSAFATLPMIFGSGQAYKEFANLEKLQIGLNQYGESLETVKKLAQLPNISIEGAASSLLALRSVEMASDKAQKTIKAFANALTAAGKSSTDLNPALANVQQMISTNTVSAADVKEMANRIPQVRKALIDAFGTAEGAELTKIGATKVVEGLVAELEKIPPVAGGAGMALEKIKDSAQFSMASFGESLEKSFNISGIINSIAESMESLTSKFKGLSPETQKTIFVLGGVAAAAGPLLAGLGAVVKMVPLLTTGLGLISAPVLAVGAAIGVAVAAIIYHWDSVKKALVSSGAWDSMKSIAKSALGVLTGLFGTVTNLIKGDWKAFGQSLANTLKSAANLMIDTLSGFIRATLGMFATFNRAIGFDALADGVGKAIDGVDKLAKSIKFTVPDSMKEFKEITKALSAPVGDSGGSVGKSASEGVEDLGKAMEFVSSAQKEMKKINQAMEWHKEQEALKGVISEYKKLFGVVAGLNVERLKGMQMNFGAPELGKLQGRADSMMSTASNLPGIKQAVDVYEKQVGRVASLNADITRAWDNAKYSMAVGMGEWIGGMIAGVSSLADLPRMFGSILGDLATQIGKSMIAFGTAGKALQSIIKDPITAVVAGVGLVALGAALKANVQQSINSKMNVPAFAEGGMVGSEMLARVGDNPNARFDNEIIAPYSKVDRSLRESIRKYSKGGDGIGELTTRISGSDLEIVLNRTRRTKAAIG
ncbi:tape measure protein [Telluribacter sp. SYSU D00476]|uniref:tape measure protein n=1 Tax=Telluribacter sp. SYSU D00476 TaxID=2811430 RepID=UPI001FF62DD0|nr:tape measure protein [Telluribacter sp. SYSU D00476]